MARLYIIIHVHIARESSENLVLPLAQTVVVNVVCLDREQKQRIE